MWRTARIWSSKERRMETGLLREFEIVDVLRLVPEK